MLSFEYDTKLYICTSPWLPLLLYDPNKMNVSLWKRKTFLFLCEEVFVIFEINYEYQIQIRWSMVYMSDQLILTYFIWIVIKGSVKSRTLEKIYELYQGVRSFFQAEICAITSINWYYELQCTSQNQVFVTYLMSYLELRGLKLLSLL